MMGMWKRPRSKRVDPSDLDRQTALVNIQLSANAEKMNNIATYLEKRKNQNGFGTDFEFTLRPRKTS